MSRTRATTSPSLTSHNALHPASICANRVGGPRRATPHCCMCNDRTVNVVSEGMEWKGFFTAGDRIFHISQDMVDAAALSDADAAEVCNTALHEARHAE